MTGSTDASFEHQELKPLVESTLEFVVRSIQKVIKQRKRTIPYHPILAPIDTVLEPRLITNERWIGGH